jgi:hypothetical protein
MVNDINMKSTEKSYGSVKQTGFSFSGAEWQNYTQEQLYVGQYHD